MLNQTELLKVTWKYNRMIWMFKGCHSNLRRMLANLPQHPEMKSSHERLIKAIENALEALEFCEHRVNMSSETHRNLLKKESE